LSAASQVTKSRKLSRGGGKKKGTRGPQNKKLGGGRGTFLELGTFGKKKSERGQSHTKK